jgi:dihydroflavonol-4-reductase
VSVLVTGATGLLGAQVCNVLMEAGHDVVAMVRNHQREPAGIRPRIAWLDVPGSLVRAMEGSTLVIHCAAVYAYGGSRQQEVERVNVDGTRNVVRAAAEAGVRRVVVTSSSVTSGSSSGPHVRDESGSIGDEFVPAYFASKVRQEQVAFETGAEHGVEVVVACPTVVLGGPSRRLVPSNAILLRYLLDPTRSTYPGGCNVVSVGDIARGHALLAERGLPGERYILGGENLSWRLLHATVADLAGVPGPYAEVPSSVALMVAAASEIVASVSSTEPLSTRDEALTIGRFHWFTHDKAHALGYSPGPARRAVAEGLAWLLAGDHVPRWVREGLRPAADVRAARRLVPRAV